eukprot:TRINITY_DN96349_c0_g1_i1.p1 TRINITY_DN96349_c0_g1~~TRINITY_DN96349_c0_g1_i1.p1  ORF type:complete len:182 (+),score=19.07 TRINITY_DN96349_c0_g1_i1:159-704(+)
MESLVDGLSAILAWNPCRSRWLRKVFRSKARALGGTSCLRWCLQISPLAGRVIEVNECAEADDFHAVSVPDGIALAPPWSLLQVTTDFEEVVQPTWVIDKQLLIEGSRVKGLPLYFQGSDAIRFANGCGGTKVRKLCIFAGGGSPAICMENGAQPWVEACKIISDDTPAYVIHEARRLGNR